MFEMHSRPWLVAYLTRGFLARAIDMMTLTISKHDCCRLARRVKDHSTPLTLFIVYIYSRNYHLIGSTAVEIRHKVHV